MHSKYYATKNHFWDISKTIKRDKTFFITIYFHMCSCVAQMLRTAAALVTACFCVDALLAWQQNLCIEPTWHSCPRAASYAPRSSARSPFFSCLRVQKPFVEKNRVILWRPKQTLADRTEREADIYSSSIA